MQIWIHDKDMRKVCALNNNIPGMLPYSNSQWHTYLEYSTSTFDFVIPKIVNGKLHDDVKYINDQMYVSFYYDNSYHVFYVAQLVENDTSFQVTCNNTNLELAMESARPLASVDNAKTLEWYLQNLDLLGFAGLEIGINEVSDKTRTITFDSQQGTKLEQLHSLMNQFDAEFVFRTELNRDGTLKRFVIDIYQQPDGNHHGIGKVRGDVVLYYQNGLKGVQVTSDKTQLFNAGYFVGKDGLNLASVVFEEKNELGQVEFYSFKDSPMVYAPLSADRYPSALGGANEIDKWTRKDFQTDYSDVNALKAYALRTIKQYAYPLLTYTVDVQSSFIKNYKDINLGDTVKIIDNNFRDGLALEARVSEMIISFDMPLNNSVVFTNFRKIANKPSDTLQQRIDEIVAKALPYRVEITTTNGTVFKNGIGRSTVKPVLKQGDKTVNATYRFIVNGEIKYAGLTYDMVASDITQPTALTVSAWVDNKEVASEEVTFLNVSDGNQGPKGADGKTSYVHTAWAYSADGKDRFTTVYPNLNLLDGTKDFSGNWINAGSWTTDGTYKGLTIKKRTSQWNGIYKKFTAPKDGTYTFSAYIKSSGNTANIMRCGGVNSSSAQSALIKYMGNNFDWTRDSVTLNLKANDVVWIKYEISGTSTDSILWTAGHKLEEGSVATPWMPSESEVTTADWPKYIGQYTNFTQVDSQNPSDYTWILVRGDDGAQGRTPYIHWAYSDNADGTGLTTSDNGQRYIGNYSDYTQADSTDKTKYRWADRLAQADPSDRNLTLNTGYKKNPLGWVQDGVSYEISGDYLKLTLIDLNGQKRIYRGEPFTVTLSTGDWINISYEAYGSKNGIRFRAQTYDTPQVQWKTLTTAPTTYDSAFQLATSRILSLFIDGKIGDVVYIRFIKTRKGKVKTPWTPAPEDVEDQLGTKADNALTQAQLNKLSETNSVMKAELEAKASLNTVNQWIKAYQDFVNANNADRAQAQRALADASARVVKLENNLGDMAERWDFIDNYMSASNDGFVIGKKDNSSSIMFNPDGRISMFSAGNEVMYISKGVIHIENGIFSKTVQIGRFREEQDYLNPDRNVIRYVGGI